MNIERHRINPKAQRILAAMDEPTIFLDIWVVKIRTVKPEVTIRVQSNQLVHDDPYVMIAEPYWGVEVRYGEFMLQYTTGLDAFYLDLTGVKAMQVVECVTQEIESGLFDAHIQHIQNEAA